MNDANTPKIYYTKMIHEQSIGNNLHFGLEEDDTFKYLARACIGRATWCPNVTCYHTLTHVKNVLLVNKFNNDPRYKKLHVTLYAAFIMK